MDKRILERFKILFNMMKSVWQGHENSKVRDLFFCYLRNFWNLKILDMISQNN